MTKVQRKYLGFACILILIWTCVLYGMFTFVTFSPDPSTWPPIARMVFVVVLLCGFAPICFETYEDYRDHEANK